MLAAVLPEVMVSTAVSSEVAVELPEMEALASVPIMVVAPSDNLCELSPCPVTAKEAVNELSPCPISAKEAVYELSPCPLTAKETVYELSPCPVTAKEAINELSPCPVMAEAACELSPFSGPADGAIIELDADFELSVMPVSVDLSVQDQLRNLFFLLSVCPISHKESNVEPPVCPAPNKKPVICPISLVVSPETVNALHVYPVNPVNDNITTLNLINMELSTLTVIAQKPAFAP